MKTLWLKYFLIVLLFCEAQLGYGQQMRSVPDSVVTNLQQQEAFKYANDPSFWEKEKPSGESALIHIIETILASNALKWLLFTFLFFMVGFVVYKIIVVNNLFAPSRKKEKKRSGSLGENELPENVDERIAAAIAAGEYRLAIRFFYLKTLNLLNDSNKIKLQARSTNDEYIRQMREHSNGSDFRMLTGIYEYVWYGEFQPDAAQFEMISQGFNQFNNRI